MLACLYAFPLPLLSTSLWWLLASENASELVCRVQRGGAFPTPTPFPPFCLLFAVVALMAIYLRIFPHITRHNTCLSSMPHVWSKCFFMVFLHGFLRLCFAFLQFCSHIHVIYIHMPNPRDVDARRLTRRQHLTHLESTPRGSVEDRNRIPNMKQKTEGGKRQKSRK